jgi:hypothetical protein
MEKWIYTESDFEDMGWHYCQLRAMAFDNDFFTISFDIDYAFKLELVDNVYEYYTSPCTLIFYNVYNLDIEIGSEWIMEFDEIKRTNPKQPKNHAHIKKDIEWDWEIVLVNGSIQFTSVGFEQHVRATPINNILNLSLKERGGISFSLVDKEGNIIS